MQSVAICGSKRFTKEIRAFAKSLRDKGVTVYEPYLHVPGTEWQALSDDHKRFIAMGLTHDHFYKMKLADTIYIYNKEGYSGVSTTMEIGFAAALGKPIYAFSEDEEICRRILFRKIITTLSALLKILK